MAYEYYIIIITGSVAVLVNRVAHDWSIEGDSLIHSMNCTCGTTPSLNEDYYTNTVQYNIERRKHLLNIIIDQSSYVEITQLLQKEIIRMRAAIA